jgi:hypothetical protein
MTGRGRERLAGSWVEKVGLFKVFEFDVVWVHAPALVGRSLHQEVDHGSELTRS